MIKHKLSVFKHKINTVIFLWNDFIIDKLGCFGQIGYFLTMRKNILM